MTVPWYQQDEFVRTAKELAQVLPPMRRFEFVVLAERLAYRQQEAERLEAKVDELREEIHDLEREVAEKDEEIERLETEASDG